MNTRTILVSTCEATTIKTESFVVDVSYPNDGPTIYYPVDTSDPERWNRAKVRLSEWFTETAKPQ